MDRSYSRFPFSASAALLPFFISVSLWSSPASASIETEEDDLVGYDVIVKELAREKEPQTATSSRARVARPASNDPFANVLIHFGAGYTASMQTLGLTDGQKAYLNQKGFQAALGIDLFSENWMAEGAVRSFGDSEEGVAQVSLREFDLKLFFKDKFSRHIGFRAGGGLSARYMTVRTSGQSTDYTTPSSVGTIGFDFFLSKAFSLGLDVSARNTMVAETIDQSSFDATLRMDTHF